LSLSGGGAKGSYEAGALWQMARMLNGSDMHYDVISGISVGAINSGALGVHEKGDEEAATEFLRQVWMNMTSGSIYQAWPGVEVYEAIFN